MRNRLVFGSILFIIFILVNIITFSRNLLSSTTVEAGTAFFINNQGYMATANHVVKGSSKLAVLYRGQLHNAYIIAIDSSNDVAIIKTDIVSREPISLTNRIIQEEPIVILGYPQPDVYGNDLKASKGTVTNSLYSRRIQNHARTCPGNSGSPVIDNYGNAVGLSNTGYFFYEYNKYKCTTEAAGPSAKSVIDLANKYHIAIDIDNFNEYNSLNTIINKYKDSVLLLYAF